jgi:hypothetical protein
MPLGWRQFFPNVGIWRVYVPPKRWYLPASPKGITTQTTKTRKDITDTNTAKDWHGV